MANEPMPDLTGAVDLAEVAKNAELRKEEEEQAAAQAARLRLQSWDKKMRRTFKGIMDRPTRIRFLYRAVQRQEADNDD